jgi:hypothetical protein
MAYTIFKVFGRTASTRQGKQDDASRVQQLELVVVPSILKSCGRFEECILDLALVQEKKMKQLPIFKAVAREVVA